MIFNCDRCPAAFTNEAALYLHRTLPRERADCKRQGVIKRSKR